MESVTAAKQSSFRQVLPYEFRMCSSLSDVEKSPFGFGRELSKPDLAVFMDLESETRKSIHEFSVLADPSNKQCKTFNRTTFFK